MKRHFLLAALLVICITGFGQVKLQTLLVENFPDPVGLDVPQPRFSWQLIIFRKNNFMYPATELLLNFRSACGGHLCFNNSIEH